MHCKILFVCDGRLIPRPNRQNHQNCPRTSKVYKIDKIFLEQMQQTKTTDRPQKIPSAWARKIEHIFVIETRAKTNSLCL